MKSAHLITIVIAAITTILGSNTHADDFVNDWFHEVSLESEYKILKQQIKDFREYKGADTQKVMYEATGEIFESREEIERALPKKEQELEKVKRDYARLVGARS